MLRARLRTVAAVAVAAGAAGAAASYLWDPDRGRLRRARLSDQFGAKVREEGRVVERRARYERGRLEGLAHKATSLRATRPEDDRALADKVRSEVLGHMPEIAQRINVDVVDGVVTLRGQLDDEDDAVRLEEAVERVPGARDVVNLVHMPDEPAPNTAEPRRIVE